MTEFNFETEIKKIEDSRLLAGVEKEMLIKKALSSTDARSQFQAQKYLSAQKEIGKKNQKQKSILIDPYSMGTGMGYRDKYFSVNFETLRKMSKTHIIKSIITTRKNQIAAFAQPQSTKYDTGFIIQKKRKLFGEKDKITKQDEEQIEKLTTFILDCGERKSKWHEETFEGFLRKLVTDSLRFDQGVFEIVPDRRGVPVEFFAVDAATYKLAEPSQDAEEIDGYKPKYVQVIDSRVSAEFYPWELCFGIRNPDTDIFRNGYGCSELEDMITVITSLLNADKYNANFFKVGSNPRGFFKYSGNIAPTMMEDFRQQFYAEVIGVENAHRIPFINAEEIDYIPTHENNRDMEYSKFQEFLIKISCAQFTIDPSEINFSLSGNSDSKPMFEGNNEARLKYSKDKGLRPLLKHIQGWINKYVIESINPNFEFLFKGMDGNDESNELDFDIKTVQYFETVNEVRKKRNMPPIKGGDIILSGVFQQAQQAAMYGNPQSNEFIDSQDSEEEEEEENPFTKSLNSYLKTIS